MLRKNFRNFKPNNRVRIKLSNRLNNSVKSKKIITKRHKFNKTNHKIKNKTILLNFKSKHRVKINN